MDQKEQEWERLRNDVARAQGLQETIQQLTESGQQSLEMRMLRLERDFADDRVNRQRELGERAKEMGNIGRSLEMVAKSYDKAVQIHDFHLVRVLSICNTILIVVFGATALFMRMVTR